MLEGRSHKVIRIIAVQMNLPDPRGGELPPSPPLNAALAAIYGLRETTFFGHAFHNYTEVHGEIQTTNTYIEEVRKYDKTKPIYHIARNFRGTSIL